jgi:hypothetical protein
LIGRVGGLDDPIVLDQSLEALGTDSMVVLDPYAEIVASVVDSTPGDHANYLIGYSTRS